MLKIMFPRRTNTKACQFDVESKKYLSLGKSGNLALAVINISIAASAVSMYVNPFSVRTCIEGEVSTINATFILINNQLI